MTVREILEAVEKEIAASEASASRLRSYKARILACVRETPSAAITPARKKRTGARACLGEGPKERAKRAA